MHKYHALVLLIIIGTFSTAAEEKMEQNSKTEDTVLIWYPIPIKLSKIEETFNDAKSLQSFSHALTLYPYKLENLPDQQIDVHNRKSSDEENLEQCKQSFSALKNGNYTLNLLLPTKKTPNYSRHTTHSIYEYGENDKGIESPKSDEDPSEEDYINYGTLHKVNPLDKSVNNKTKNYKNGSLIMNPKDSTIEGDLLKYSIVEDLLSTRSTNSETSNEDGVTKAITFKISLKDSDLALDQTSSESKENSKYAATSRLLNIFSTPSVDATTESNTDDVALNKGIKLFENTEVYSLIINKTAVTNGNSNFEDLEQNVSNDNVENQTPSLDQTNDESEAKTESGVSLDDGLSDHDENFRNLVEELLRKGDDLVTTEVNTEYSDLPDFEKNNISENNLSTAGYLINSKLSTRIDSNSKNNITDTKENTEKKTESEENADEILNEQKKEETQSIESSEKYTETNEEKTEEPRPNEGEYTETHEEYTTTNKEQNSQDNAEDLEEDLKNSKKNLINKKSAIHNENPEVITFKMSSVTEANTDTTIALRTGMFVEEVPVLKDVKSINITNYSKCNNSFGVLYRNNSEGNVDSNKKDDTSFVLIKKYLLDLNKNNGNSNSGLSNTELDQLTSVPNKTTCKCMYHVLKVLLSDLIKKKFSSEETNTGLAASQGLEKLESTKEHER